MEPVQVAKLIVQSYPFPPDLLSVISCLVEEAGEPRAGDLLAFQPLVPALTGISTQ